MKIDRLAIKNIGGLTDCDLALPDQQLIAFAGANGTGKSKLLACLLAPWIRTIPAAEDATEESKVLVDFTFDEDERTLFGNYDRQSGWNQGKPPSQVSMSIAGTHLTGLTTTTEPLHFSISEGLHNSNFLLLAPSVNLVYLPAERRLVAENATAVDLSQLTVEVAVQRLIEARGRVGPSGHLDDQEFETYAKALCVAGSLPSEDTVVDTLESAESQWDRFRDAVDAMLFPKRLLPLTRQNPSKIRIGLPGGGSHEVSGLSSGERQALIIISRVFRAGEGHSLVAIDEPDAYLHPTLNARLLRALRPGLEDGGRLIVATHSPSILDALPPEAIFRLAHGSAPATIQSEGNRLDLYRESGFRASSLTQADLLVVTEGDFDAAVLPQLVPGLGGASIRGVGGRGQVIRSLESLHSYDLPIIGVIDADVMADAVPSAVSASCHVWQVADIEAALLSDKSFLEAAIAGSFMKAPYTTIAAVDHLLRSLLHEAHDQAVSECAQRIMQRHLKLEWPSPRGNSPLARLRALASDEPRLSAKMIDAAITEAEVKWAAAMPTPWTMVRGKWILPVFVSQATQFKSGEAFIHAVAARQPTLVSMKGLIDLVTKVAKN